MSTTSFMLALLAGLAVGVVIGCVNGLLVSFIGRLILSAPLRLAPSSTASR
jgi:ribose/xylose/arabinose/galactoside ABC-type transport system permease subunit